MTNKYKFFKVMNHNKEVFTNGFEIVLEIKLLNLYYLSVGGVTNIIKECVLLYAGLIKELRKLSVS